jgi:O-antigen ligase
VFFVYPLDWYFEIGAGITVQESEGITLTDIFSVMLVATCFWKVFLTKDGSILRIPFSTPVTFLIMMNIGVMLLSTMVSKAPSQSLGVALQRVTLLVFYILVVYLAKDRRKLRFMIMAFVSSAILTIIAGSYEIITQESVLGEQRYSATLVRRGLAVEESGTFRVQGFNPEPDGHATQMLMQLGLLLYLIYWLRSAKARLVGLVIMLLMQVNIVATGARGTWLGLVIVMGAFLVFAPLPRKRRLITGALALGIAGSIALVALFPDLAVKSRFLGKSTEGNFALRVRGNLIAVSFEIWRQNPWLGVGPGNFRYAYPQAVRVVPSLSRAVVPAPHNIYMAVLAETGIVGLAFYLALHLAVFWQIYNCIRNAPDEDAKVMGVGIFVSFLVFTYCLNFYSLAGSKYGWAVMAFAGAFYKVLIDERTG